jgi:hypothetical protein
VIIVAEFVPDVGSDFSDLAKSFLPRSRACGSSSSELSVSRDSRFAFSQISFRFARAGAALRRQS